MNKQEKLQAKAAEFESLRQELEGIDMQLSEVSYRNKEFKTALETIKQVKKTQKNHEFIMPISEGLMIKVLIKDPDKAFIGIGNSVVIEKNSQECIEYIKDRIDEADSINDKLNEEADKITLKLRVLESELSELSSQGE